jgi:hypothetical protein
MNNEDLIESRKRKIAIEIINCLDELYEFDEDNILIKTIHHNDPKYFIIEINDKNNNKIGIIIHKYAKNYTN